jgi:hypothetical protein
MASIQRTPAHSTGSTNIADLLERVLDKGVVIAGDIKISLVDIELLSIQIRLVICSVDKAKEMGMDWWVNHPVFSAQKAPAALEAESVLSRIEQRLESLEKSIRDADSAAAAPLPASPSSAVPAIAPTVPDWVRTPRPPV